MKISGLGRLFGPLTQGNKSSNEDFWRFRGACAVVVCLLLYWKKRKEKGFPFAPGRSRVDRTKTTVDYRECACAPVAGSGLADSLGSSCTGRFCCKSTCRGSAVVVVLLVPLFTCTIPVHTEVGVSLNTAALRKTNPEISVVVAVVCLLQEEYPKRIVLCNIAASCLVITLMV